MRSLWKSGGWGKFSPGMKVLHAHLSKAFFGSERYCASLARAQARAGMDVRVVIKGTRNQERGTRVARWRAEAAPAEVLCVPWWVPGFMEQWVIEKFMRGFVPQMVHTHLGRANVRVGRVAKKLKLPWVVTLHLRWKDKEMMGSDGLICIAGWQRKEVPHAYRGMMRVVWNWLPEIGTKADGKALRKKLDCGKETVVFGSVGRLHSNKGMDVLVRAFRQAFNKGEDVRLVIAGEGDQRKDLEALCEGDRRIVLAGNVAEIGPYYAGFDVYVSAARYEPFGLSILEAMDAGLPLICSRSEGPSEYLQGHPVRWVEKGKLAGMTSALRDEFAKGRHRVEYDMSAFTLDKARDKILEFYTKVMKARGL